jgi:hypothetical protein
MSKPPQTLKTTLKPIKEVFGNAEILTQIVRNLDDGCARDLVSALQVSRSFFHASATTLCRRVQVPLYEFSRTKERDQQHLVRYGYECESCDGDRLAYCGQSRNVTAHRAMEPGLSKEYVEMIHTNYRAIYPATLAMMEMYKYVRVVTVDSHVGCDHLIKGHPLPMVRTVVVQGGNDEVCLTSKSSSSCGFLPSHPFRLILDGLCSGLICRACTSPQILSPYAETVVLRLQHHPYFLPHKSRNLPKHFNPKRLVLLFPQERLVKSVDHELQWGVGREDSTLALGPGEGGNPLENMFYRIAQMCLLVNNDCKIYVVAADQAALHLKGLERFETPLEDCRPKAPEPQKPIHHYSDGLPLCYSQDGQIVSSINPRRVPPTLLPVAESMIQKRVGAIETLVHKWLDFILDSRMPLEHWEDEKDSVDESGLRKWDNRDQFERHLHHLKAKKEQEKNQKWHNKHRCWAGCRDDYTPEVPDSEDEDEDGNLIVENGRNVWADYGRPWEERLGDESKRIVEAKKWRRGQKLAKTREEIEAIRKIKHGRIQFISTYEYHKMEGNNDEMDDPSKYL